MFDKINRSEPKINSEVENTEEIDNEIETEIDTETKPEQIESIETEIGLKEVALEPENLDAVAAEQTNTIEDFDTLDENLDREIDEREVGSELPSEFTQTYGTGLKGQPLDRTGRQGHYSRRQKFNEADPILTGGDPDANYEQANAVGDEAVGGTVTTPEQDIVDNLGAAVGLEMSDRTSLRTNEILEQRDEERWETDPQSSEDYEKRRGE